METPGTWIFKNIPRSLMWRAKMAAASQGTTVKQMILDLVEAHCRKMEKTS